MDRPTTYEPVDHVDGSLLQAMSPGPRLREHALPNALIKANRPVWSIRSWIPKVADQMPIREQHGYSQGSQRNQRD